MPSTTGAQAIVRLLERQGTRTIAGIPGGSNLPLYHALAESRLIHHVLARHEQGAGFMAQGMARVTGEVGVCLATSGPGATNILTAIADAKLDSVPVVCITGQVPRAMIGTDAFQEVDTYGMSIPITKHNFLVRAPEELLDIVPEAFRLAASGRPGPVLIDVPKDVQTAVLDVEEWPEPGQRETPPPCDAAALTDAVARIQRAERPILYVGGGAIHAGAGEAIARLADKAGIPVTTTLLALGSLPVDHPRNLGMLGMHGARSTNLALEECDLLIVVGARFDDRATGRLAEFCPEADVIHIDIDASEINKLRRAAIGLRADARATVEAIVERVEANARAKWNARIEQLRREHPLHRPDEGDVRTPYGLIRAVAQIAGPRALVATDVGQHQMWVAQAYPFQRPRTWLTSGGLGTMGFGLPAAIGAALALPSETVVCFSGDGSLMMNIQELATAVEENANVKVVLMNNNALGLVGQQQDLFFGGRRFACDYRHAVDFTRIAEGFGMPTFDLKDASEPRRVLAEAMERPGPCFIHVPIDSRRHVYPMVPPGAANRQMIGGERHVDATA